MLEAALTPRGPYVLRQMVRSGRWRATLPGDDSACAWQRDDGAVVVRAQSEAALERARFMLALDGDHSEFVRRFSHDRLLGPSVRGLWGLRPLRLATVAHAALRALCGQLIESGRARAVERSILRAAGSTAPSQDSLARFSPAELRRLGLAARRAAALVRLCRTVDLERLRDHPTPTVLERLLRERAIGPWSCGVLALQGLGRYDHGLVGDLGLVKLTSSLQGRWVGGAETAELLAPYGEWQGLASVYLLTGWKLGLVPGADPDAWRRFRERAPEAQ